MNKFKNQQTIGFIINDISRLMRRDFNRKVADLHLTQAQWQILVLLSRMEGSRQSKIAEVLEMQPISVARMIDRMAAAKWVERRPDPEDRRAFNVFLTEKAEPILEKMWLRAAETRKAAVAGMTNEEQDLLFALLQKMRSNLASEESK